MLIHDYSIFIDALGLKITTSPVGSEISLEYRIDAEGVPSTRGIVRGVVPANFLDP
jgi:hypothetical protein